MQEQHSSQSAINTCTICIQRSPEALLDSCQHRFCLRCIRKWSKKKNTCPLCRQIFKNIECHGRSYKVDPPRAIPHPSRNLVQRLQNLQRRIVYIPVIYSISMPFNMWNPSYLNAQNTFNHIPLMNEGPSQGFSWVQPTFIIPFSNQ